MKRAQAHEAMRAAFAQTHQFPHHVLYAHRRLNLLGEIHETLSDIIPHRCHLLSVTPAA
jgi:hypothetical protein